MNQQQGMSGQQHTPATPTPVRQATDKQDNFIQASFKQDVTKARELLTDLLNKSTSILQENTKQPGNQRDSHRLRLEKGLEELFAILDQMESNLKLAIQWHTQTHDSKRHMMAPIAGSKADDGTAKMSVSLNNYMRVARFQIQAAKELHDFITDAENRLQTSQPTVPVTPVSTGPTSNPLVPPPMPSVSQSQSHMGMNR